MTNLEIFYITISIVSIIFSISFLMFTCLYLKEHKKETEYGFFSSLLSYERFIDDTTILLKNRNYLVAFNLEIPNLIGTDTNILNKHVDILEKAIFNLGPNFCIHFDCIRDKTQEYNALNHSQNETLAFFERKRQEIFLNNDFYRSSFYIAISSINKGENLPFLSLLNKYDQTYTNTSLKEFKASIYQFIEALKPIFKIRELSYKDNDIHYNFLSYLNKCISNKDIKFNLEHVNDHLLSDILSCEHYEHLKCPKIGSKHIVVVAIDNLPPKTFTSMLDKALLIKSSFRFNTRFISFESNIAQNILKRQRKLWAQNKRSLFSQIFNLNSNININAQNKVDDVNKENCKLEDEQNIYGSFSSNIVLMHEDLNILEHDIKGIIANFEKLGFNCRVENFNTTESYLGTLPSNYHCNVRSIIISNNILADLIPISYEGEGDFKSSHKGFGTNASCMLQAKTRFNNIYNLNLHTRDLGNTVIFGPPGSGKSVLLNHLILSIIRYKNIKIFAFDKGFSLYGITKALGGSHCILNNSNSSFCPLYHLENDCDLDFAREYIELLMSLSKTSFTSKDSIKITDTLNILKNQSNSSRSLTDFLILVNDEKIKNALLPFTISVDENSLLDGKYNISFDNQLTCFECQDLFTKSEKHSIATLSLIFRLIERHIDKDPLCIILDEAWMMFNNDLFANKLLQWIKTLRKHNVFLIMATQSIADISEKEYFSVFLDCINSKIFLANNDISNNKESSLYYKKFGLNDETIDLISKMKAKDEYLLHKDSKASLFSLVMSDEELSLCSLSTKLDKDKIDFLIDTYNKSFYKHILEI